MSIFEYVDLDYKDGKLGLRIEPKNEDLIEVLKASIPPQHRAYFASKRRWILDPMAGGIVAQLIKDFVPDYPVQVEEKNKDLILSLLFGPRVLPNRQPMPASARVVQIKLGGPTIGDWLDIAGKGK